MLLLTFLAATVAAEPAPKKTAFADASGNYVYSACTDATSGAATACSNYVMGVADTLNMIGEDLGIPVICNQGVVVKQIVDVVTNYLRADPENRHFSAAWLTATALKEAFPCPKQERKAGR